MKKRICPICDQEMRSAHYCKNCRSWVKEPWVRDVGYYLNERHPAQEADCSYHGESKHVTGGFSKNAEGGRSTGRNASAAGTEERNVSATVEGQRAGQDLPGWKQKEQPVVRQKKTDSKAKNSNRAGNRITAIIFLLIILMKVFPLLLSMVEHVGKLIWSMF